MVSQLRAKVPHYFHVLNAWLSVRVLWAVVGPEGGEAQVKVISDWSLQEVLGSQPPFPVSLFVF